MRRIKYCARTFPITFIVVTVLLMANTFSVANIANIAAIDHRLIESNYSRVARHNHQLDANIAVPAATETSSSAPCGGYYGDSDTVLRSPNYPANYPRNARCAYVLRSPVRCACEFHVQFVDFNLQTSVGCANDRLQIGTADVLCGRVIGGRRYKTADGVLRMLLHTDDEVESTGFEVRVKRLPCETSAAGTTSSAGVYPIYVRQTTTEPTTVSVAPAAVGRSIENGTRSNNNVVQPSFYASQIDPNRFQPVCWSGNINPAYPSFNPAAQQPGFQPPVSWSGNINPAYPSFNPAAQQPGFQPPVSWQYPVVGPPSSYPPSTYNPAYYPTHINPPNVPNYPPPVVVNNQPAFPQYPASYPPTIPPRPTDANVPPNNGNYPPSVDTPSPSFPLYPSYPPTNTANGAAVPGSSTQCIPFCLPPQPQPNPNPQLPEYPSRVEHQAQIHPPNLPRCCSRILNQRRFYLTSPDFPSRTPQPASRQTADCVYHIERAHPAVCRLRVEFRFFNIGTFEPLTGCQHSYVDIDGQRMCGCNTGLVYVSQWGLGAKVIRLRHLAFGGAVPHQNVRGFWLDVVQEECPYRLTDAPRNTDAIGRRADSVEPIRLHSTVTNTNSSSVTRYFYYDNTDPEAHTTLSPHRLDAETKGAFDMRAEAPAVSAQFFFADGLVPNRDRCTFGYAQYLRLAADPRWQTRPRCDI